MLYGLQKYTWLIEGGVIMVCHQMAVLSHRSTAIGAVTSPPVGHLGKLYLAKQPTFYFR